MERAPAPTGDLRASRPENGTLKVALKAHRVELFRLSLIRRCHAGLAGSSGTPSNLEANRNHCLLAALGAGIDVRDLQLS